MSRASSWPVMTSIGNPSARSACGRKTAPHWSRARNVFVATARTADGCRPRMRSPKRARQASAARLASGTRRPRVVDSRADAQRLAPGIEPVDLVAFDAADLQAEAVRAHVDDGKLWRRWAACAAWRLGACRARFRARDGGGLGAVQGASPRSYREYGESEQRTNWKLRRPKRPVPSLIWVPLPKSASALLLGLRRFTIFAAPRAAHPSLFGPATRT